MRVYLLLLFFCFNNALAQTTNSQPAPQKATGAQFNFINNDRGHDFDELLPNTTTTYKVEFKNSGDAPLTISDMHCDAHKSGKDPYTVKVTWPEKPVKPGKKGIITVSITVQDETGSFSNSISVTSNATSANFALLYFRGAVVPARGEHVTSHKMTDDMQLFDLLGPVIINNTK